MLKATGECNGGAVVASSISTKGNCYTSQMNITITRDMINNTDSEIVSIECAHDRLIQGEQMTQITSVGNLTITEEGIQRA